MQSRIPGGSTRFQETRLRRRRTSTPSDELRGDFRVTPSERRGDDARILLYGHDTFGLGHLRRNLALATRLTQTFPNVSVLLLTGSSSVQSFPMPERVDYLKLPTVVKVADEEYIARTLRMDSHEMVELRASLIRSAVIGFAPDVLLVDHAPLGMKGEILPALYALRRIRPQARIALGLRDIVDEPERVRAQWKRQQVYEVMENLYDRLLVYGTPEIVDVNEAYGIPPQVAEKTRYCGYLRRDRSLTDPAALRAQYCHHGERLALVTVGGGGDGYPLLHAYLSGLSLIEEKSRVVSVVVTGPFMPPEELAELSRLAAEHPTVHLIEFTGDPLGLMQAADLVVCMGGYNTLCEILSVGVRALVVPRVEPRREQLIRAEAFAKVGLVDSLPQDELTPATLAARVSQALAQGAVGQAQTTLAIDRFVASGALNGLEEAMRQIGLLLHQAAPTHDAPIRESAQYAQ